MPARRAARLARQRHESRQRAARRLALTFERYSMEVCFAGLAFVCAALCAAGAAIDAGALR